MLETGTKVRVQNPISKRWDKTAVIIDVGNRRNYRIKFESGRASWRNRRFLRKWHGAVEDDVEPNAEPDAVEDDAEPNAAENPTPDAEESKPAGKEPRRSKRNRKVRFQNLKC